MNFYVKSYKLLQKNNRLSGQLHGIAGKYLQKIRQLSNTLKVFDPYWAKENQLSYIFYEKEERVQLSFWEILFLMAYNRPKRQLS